MSGPTGTVSRERELELYIADLHARIRKLESTLSALVAVGETVASTAKGAIEKPRPVTPEGVHRLHHPKRLGGKWLAVCSCGWNGEWTIRHEAAADTGAAHVAEELAR